MSRFARRRFARKSRSIPEITLTPLIDTALTLLVIFMVATPLIHNGIKIDLPKGNVQEIKGIQEEVVIHLDKQLQLFVNGKTVKRDQLCKELHEKIINQSSKTVFVKGDGKVEYNEIIKLIEDIKTIKGIERVALATERLA